MFFEETIKDASKYSDKVADILTDQKKKYDILNQQNIVADLIQNDLSTSILLPFGTLIHGTTFNKEKLEQIKKEGILSSEFSSNTPERCTETYYMADFFKVVSNSPISVNTLLNCYNRRQVVDYLPNDKPNTEICKVAFVVNNSNKLIQSYLKRDLFADNNIDLFEFIDEDFCYSLQSRKKLYQYNNVLGQSSIPLGIPFNALSAIIIDYNIENVEKDKLEFLIKTFGKELYIISSTGKIISYPIHFIQNSDIIFS